VLTYDRMRFFNQTVRALTTTVNSLQGAASGLVMSWLLLGSGLLAVLVGH